MSKKAKLGEVENPHPKKASYTQQDTCLLIYLSGIERSRRFWRRLGENILNRKLSKSTQRGRAEGDRKGGGSA